MAELTASYASALFDLAVEKGKAQEYSDQAGYLMGALADEDCVRLLEHPNIPDKGGVFLGAFKEHISEDMYAFLSLIFDKKRETSLVAILREFVAMVKAGQKKAVARVISAAPLSIEETEELREMLSEKLQKTVEISAEVDPSALGSVYIYADGYFIDYTVKKRLHQMAADIKRGCGV